MFDISSFRVSLLRRLRHWRTPALPLRTVALALFAAQVVLVVGIAGGLSFYNGRQAVSELVDRLIERTTQQLVLEVDRYFQAPKSVNHAVQGALALDAIDLQAGDADDRAALVRLFAQQLQFFDAVVDDNIETVQFATTDADWRYIGVGYARDARNKGEGEGENRQGQDAPGELVVKRADRETGSFVQSRYREDGTAGAEIGRVAYDITKRDWYVDGLAADRPAWSPIYSTASTGELGIMRTEPVRDRQGRTIGLLGTDLRLATLARFLERSVAGDNGKAYLVERETWQPIATSAGRAMTRRAEDGTERRLTPADIPQLARVEQRLRSQGALESSAMPSEVMQIAIDGKDYFVRAMPLAEAIELDWLLVSLVPTSDFLELIEQQKRQTLLLCAIALLVSIGVGALSGRSIGRPILLLSRAAKELSAGQLDPLLLKRIRPRLRVREIETLRYAFRVMQVRLQESFDRLESRVAQQTAELRERERELRQSERFLNSIIENLPVAVFVKDVRDDFRLISLNQHYEAIAGRSRAELEGKTVAELYEPTQAEQFRDHDLQTVERGALVEIDAEPFTNARGERRVLRTSKVPIRDDRGEIAYLLGISQDITERHRNNAQLRAQREVAPDGILVFDERDEISAYNQRFLELWNIPIETFDWGTEAVLDAMRARMTTPDEFDTTLAYHREFPNVNSRNNIELQIEGRGKRVFERHSRAVSAGDGQGREEREEREYFGRIWFFRDITDLQEKERQWRESEAYIRIILDNIPQQVFWKDTNLVFRGCNRHWADAAGLESPDEAVGKTDFDLLPAKLAEEFREADMAIVNSNKPVLHVQAVKFKPGEDGKRIWLDISKLPIQDREGNVVGILGVLDDITLRREAEEALRAEQEALRKEQERSEQLLLNILPKSIADSLKIEQRSIAKHFQCASILFADIVGFTPLSSELEPIELVDLLNQIFTVFDGRAMYHGLEKIKTIGDAYMVAGGLPMENSYHIDAIAEMALDMQREVRKLRDRLDRDIAIRVGLHIGPVVAGVIGTSKFIYDLWGDTVNIASRMESFGEPDRVQISETAYKMLYKHYKCELRGTIEVKGKGQMKTYWLNDRQEFFHYRSEYAHQHADRKLESLVAEVRPIELEPNDTLGGTNGNGTGNGTGDAIDDLSGDLSGDISGDLSGEVT